MRVRLMNAAARRLVVWCGAVLAVGVAVTAVTVTAGRPSPIQPGLTPAQQDETLRAHNVWRARAAVVPLCWAEDLAARAQARAGYLAANGCLMVHGPLPADVGENLFRAGPLHGEGRPNQLFVVTPTQVVDMWGAESTYYSTVLHTCAPNRQCGHYTQLVWAATREVGCGMSVCPTLGQIWVCNYRPRGNVWFYR